MPISSGEIEFRLSGGAGNTSPAASWGGAKSSTPAGANIFDNVTGSESAAGSIEYRCIYVHNADPALSMLTTKVWLQAQNPGTYISIGAAPEGLNATAQNVGNTSTAPTSVTFSAAAAEGSAISLGDIPFGQHYAIWIKRDVTAGAAAASAGFTLRVKCDTEA